MRCSGGYHEVLQAIVWIRGLRVAFRNKRPKQRICLFDCPVITLFIDALLSMQWIAQESLSNFYMLNPDMDILLASEPAWCNLALSRIKNISTLDSFHGPRTLQNNLGQGESIELSHYPKRNSSADCSPLCLFHSFSYRGTPLNPRFLRWYPTGIIRRQFFLTWTSWNTASQPQNGLPMCSRIPS